MRFVVRERTKAIEVLALNRPERRNALGEDLLEDLESAIENAAADRAVNVIVLAGNGPGFSAGADLKDYAARTSQERAVLDRRLGAFVRSLALIEKPVVSAVEGFAMGAGFMLAAACDVVVTSSAARWHLPEVSLGWLPGFGLNALAMRVGPVAARFLTWNASAIQGEEAFRLGLADIVADPDETARDAALRYAAVLADLPPHAVRTTKQYFAPLISSGSEVMDSLANRSFAQDVQHETAQANMNRFRRGKQAQA
ncbi:enoyl-CoA hydratase/isomerase family protein [Phyllobacterium chamaecytisi]|uniref:enoyl-CoA hydratase/isomerase family protein n=1 Tax=Phyllobacterium chamaecytisi TaxID=2876082 RepID=UPI001CCDAD56|nr:enoyl-CoA hydratase/isomerase family protein [Phyllobacterium sp. KW56]MBZ9603289.1 enoyl-CoA hydratase/isomerase family protein [Phyllobacterium sp. KW56]